MTRAEKVRFFALFAPMAQQSQRQFGVPASVTLAQAFLESADRDGNPGQSQLAREANNFFGIKARTGDAYVEFKSAEIENGERKLRVSRFERFETIADSFQRHGELLSKCSLYAPAMAMANDPEAFAFALRAKDCGGCGYSTNPKYGSQVGGLIRQYNLAQYDIREAA